MGIERFHAFCAGLLACSLLLILILLSPALQAATDSYRIAPGDAISIQVYGEPDLTLEQIPVPSSGVISYPLIGEIRAAGFTEKELAAEIEAKLRGGYLLRPEVTVTISHYRPIYVGGEVEDPGQKEYAIGMDVEKVLALSGGLTEEANREEIVIQRTRDGKKVSLKADLSTPVMPGDIITIGKSRSSNLYIYLHGEVRKPGRYRYTKGLTVEKAIVIAGGFGLRASKRKISITRGDPPKKIKRVKLDEVLRPGDVVSVGVSLF